MNLDLKYCLLIKCFESVRLILMCINGPNMWSFRQAKYYISGYKKKRFVAFFLKIFIDLLGTKDFSVADSVFRSCKISHRYVVKVFQYARGNSGYFVTNIFWYSNYCCNR